MGECKGSSQLSARAVAVLVMLSAVALLVSGCFRYDHRIKIDDDGSGTIEVTGLFDPEIAFEELSGQRVLFDRSPGYDRDAVCSAMQPGADADLGLPEGEFEPYEKDGFCGFRLSTDLEASDDHSELVSSIFEPGSVLEKTGDRWEFRAMLDPAIFTEMAENLELSNFEFDKYADVARYRIDIDLPGSAVAGENDADDVSGGRFIWNIDVLNVPTEIHAVTEPTPPFWENTTTLAVLGVLGVGLLAILGFFVFGGRERSAAPVAPAVESRSMVTGRQATVTDAAAGGEPYFDDAFGVWVRDDPVHGRLWHDTKRNVWVPF